MGESLFICSCVSMVFSTEVQKEEKDQEKLAALNEEVRSLYGRIMAHPTMAAYNTTKEELDRLLNLPEQSPPQEVSSSMVAGSSPLAL